MLCELKGKKNSVILIMLSQGIRPIGDGLLEVAAERLQGLLVREDINEIYDVEQTPFAR